MTWKSSKSHEILKGVDETIVKASHNNGACYGIFIIIIISIIIVVIIIIIIIIFIIIITIIIILFWYKK